MSRMRSLDGCSGDKEGHDPHKRMRELASFSDKRTSDWPFLFTADERGIVVNRPPPKKKGWNSVKEIGAALL